ncbi:hypothetical protein QVD17_01119 [Tagetes erecta]|uniref:Uncharacterized protein n=1 Tax=Tagetes erecta TaxID=13708 RepID=A0AAD8L6F7_TARER|nr:hypothetical protein QVD17_01119 [Tagetes erecta]
MMSVSPKHHLQTIPPTPINSTSQSHHNDHHRNHQYLSRNDYLNSWTLPNDPKQAQYHLSQLRRDYAMKVKAVRKGYIQEMEVMRLEKQRRDEVKKEAMRIEGEERKAAKALAKKMKAAERQVAQEKFQQTLLKERAKKLEYHKSRENKIMEKKNEKARLLKCQSSVWIDEPELEAKILEAIVDSTVV